MKDSMSNIDIRLILPELREAGEGAFIKNVYQYDNIFVLKLYKSGGGTTQLLIEPGRRIHHTEYSRKAPRQPPHFCTVLRKYLREKRIISITQHDLDRIVIIEVGDDNESYKLVAELFGSGNMLLLDPKDTIFIAMHYKKMRDRNIVPKELYEFPPVRGEDLFSSIDSQSFESMLSDSKANIVRTLASRLNLDSLSCEEICALSSVSSKLMVDDIDQQTLADLKNGLTEFIQKLKIGVSSPNVVLNDEPSEDEDDLGYIAFLPFKFKLYQELPTQDFDSFSQAIDDFFGVSDSELEDEQVQDALSEEQKRLQRIIDKQNEGIDNLVSKAEKTRTEGELIYSYFTLIQEVLETVTKARTKGVPWDDIIERINEGKKKGIPSATLIERIIPSQGQIIVNLNGTSVELDIRLTAQDNAAMAYDQAKKAESKVNGARRQIEKARAKLERLEAGMVEPEAKRVRIKTRKKRWYEKFRWFISSEGFLVIGGRDAKSNENLAKYQMSPNDVFLHASIHGAPYTLIKVPDEAPGENTLEEAAQFAVTFSRAWQDGLTSGDAFWVNPEQVSFTPPSGEYLPSGSVMLYGTKNYIRNTPVELAVGVLLEEEYAIPISGPPRAIESQTEYFVRIEPGSTKKGQMVKEILNHIKNLVPEEQASLVIQIPQEDMMRVLPSGEGRIVNKS
jgi:predicted ribosome quality control (RQC) complex YloA/Tae2 family protein